MMQTVSRLTRQFRPTHYNLSLNLNRADRVFNGIVTIKGSTSGALVTLHSKDLVIESVAVDGKTASFKARDNDELHIAHDNIVTGTHLVVIAFSGTITDAMHGLYPCYFEYDGSKKELLATQFESHHAREVFPCVDEPEAKATFDVTLTTEQDVTALGNMPVKLQRVEDEKLVTTFDTTPIMSVYLLAWVVGELHKATAITKGGVEVNVWATPAQPLESLDFALDIAVRTIDFFDDYFGVAYPLPKSDHVALPDFSSGAMENWGLITYREIALLADPKTTSISSRRYMATVVAHELSHQWFGNLVTMKWWNNLWLNESFATLMEYIAVDALEPSWNVWLDFASHESLMALRRDSLEGVQAVQIDVNHPDEISTLFDGAIVYAKGARLLRMLQQYIDHEAFQTGLKNYFTKHAYGNTEADDLWNELSVTSGKDIAQFMTTWISQSGYPVLHVAQHGAVVSLSQEQFFVGPHEPSQKIWPIPLGSTDSALPELLETNHYEGARETASTLRFNDGDTAHFITHYDDVLLARLIEEVKSSALSPLHKLQLLHEQTMLARGGVISTASIIPLLGAYADETNESVWDIISVAIGELKKFTENDKEAETALRTLAGKLAAVQYERLGWVAVAGEPETDTKLRATILGLTIYSENPDAIAKAKAMFDASSLETIDPELRPLIVSTVVRHSEDDQLVNALMKRHKATSSAELQSDIAIGVTSTKNPIIIKYLLDAMKNNDVIRTQDVARWFAYFIRGRESRELAWRWVRDNWAWIETTFSGDKSYDDYARYSAFGLVTRTQLEEYRAFFTPLKDIPALTRVIAIGISEIEGRVELIERDGDAVRLALRQL